MPLQLNSLWIGTALDDIHRLCLLSALRQGHAMRLYAYNKLEGVPDGIECADANEIIPKSEIFLHGKTKSPAPFSDRFRYEMVARGKGAWIDTDILLLKPMRQRSPGTFGWESERLVTNAVFHMEQDHPVLAEIQLLAQDNYPVPPWFPMWYRSWLNLRHIAGRPAHVSQLKWGITGPHLLTYLFAKHDMLEAALPAHTFCPVPYERRNDVFAANSGVENLMREDTIGVHLWHQGLRGGLGRLRGNRPDIPPAETGSFIDTQARKVGMNLRGS